MGQQKQSKKFDNFGVANSHIRGMWVRQTVYQVYVYVYQV